MEFEWDEIKNFKNIEKHGIDFTDAALIFEYPVMEFEDNRKDYGEKRFCAIGILKGLEIAVVYTKRGQRIRLISARRAHSHERKHYYSLYPSEPAKKPH